MPSMVKPTMFADMPTKRPHFFFLIPGKKYFALKKCESRLVAIVIRHVGRSSSGNNPRYSRRYPPHPDPGSWRMPNANPLPESHQVEAGLPWANLLCGFVRRFEVGRNHPCASFCQCQGDRLADALAGAGDQRYAPLVCSYRGFHYACSPSRSVRNAPLALRRAECTRGTRRDARFIYG